MKKLLILVLVLFSSATASFAQSDPFNAIGNNESGVKPFGSYDGSKFDQVDLATGGLNLTLDIASLSARGHKSTYGWRYSSKFWMATSSFNGGQIVTTWTIENTSLGESHNSAIFPVNAGWRDTRSRLTYISSQIECIVNGLPKTYTGLKTGYTFVDENGAKHSFPNNSVPSTVASNCGLSSSSYATGYSNDGALRLTQPGGISFPSGGGSPAQGILEDTWAVTNTAPTYSDSNGNTWSVLTAANGQTFVQLILDATPRLSSIQTLDQNSAWQTWSIVNTTAANSGSPHSGSLSVPGTLTMPNGKSFTFTYGGDWGELTKVTLPTGGYIRFEYTTIVNGALTGNQGQPIPGRFVTKRAVSPDGTAASEQVTNYSYVLNTSNSNFLTTTVTRPDGSYEIHYFDISWGKPTKELWVESHAAGGALLRRRDNTWTCDLVPTSSFSDASDFYNFDLPSVGPANCRITQVLTTLDDGKKSQVNNTFDSFTYTDSLSQTYTETRGNIKKVEETDFGTSAPGPVVRVTKFKYLHEQNSAYAGSSAYIVNRVAAKWVGTPTNTFALSETQYDTTTPTGFHGNPSVTQSALLQAGAPNPDDPPDSSVSSWRATSHSYDSFGNQTSTTDPGGHTTTFEYAQCTSGYLSATNYAITGFRDEKTWNCSIGAPLTNKDLNSQITSFEYNDPMFRLTKMNKPDTGYVMLGYDDTSRVVTATELVNNGAATTLSAQHNFDGLGRLTESSILGDACGGIKSDTIYDSVGRVSQVSNPYCLQTEPTYGLTTYQYDGLDRKKLLIPPDGSVSANNVSTVYAGNCTTVTDQAGKTRRNCSDSLGRVIQVFEPNATGSLVNETDFQYDVLNNLLCVVQKGTDTTAFTNCASALSTWRPRSATYNSLSQLVSSTNPETGTISYTYDLDGNVLTRLTPAPNQSGSLTVTTTYSHDAMHRSTGKTYSNGEASVAYFYDQTNCLGLAACYNKGRRTGMTDAAGSESWAYDLMGRVAREQRVTNGVTKTTSYTYYLDGSIATIVYPTGRTITYGYDAMTRPVSAVDAANLINYVTAATYSPAGGLASLQNGAALISKFYYNKRLQPCRISVKNSGTSPSQCSDTANIGNILDFTYDYNLGAADNGLVKQIANNRNTARTQNFTYDSLNRILTATTQATSGTYSWGLQFGYDIWGNLLTSTLTQGSAPNLSVAADTKNRVVGYCYDAAGNLLAQVAPPCTVPTWSYDAENRLKTAAGVTYTYDGDGNRVKKSSGKLYWYGSGSEILSETDASGNAQNDYIFFGGKRIARVPANAASNAGFEQGTQGWSLQFGAQLITDSSRAHSGSNYVQLSTSGTQAIVAIAQNVPVQPGQQITFGGWAYRESGTSGGVRWKLAVWDSNLNPIAYPDPSPNNVASGSWAYQVGSYTVPSNAAYVALYAEIYLATSATVARFDDGFLGFGAFAGSGPLYYFADHLGSSRVVTDAAGNILDDADFYPFGGERTYSSTSGNTYKFTGKERDTESGLDNFGARYYTYQLGRFMTPDWSASPVLVPYADLGNPQTFNLYSYVANNPLNTVDPEGHFRLDPPGSFRSHYHDPDTGDPMYGDPASEEEREYLAEVAAAQQNSTQQAQQPASSQSHEPVSSVIVLGQTVAVTYAAGVSDADRLAASNAVVAAVGLINGNAGSLSADEKKAIRQIKSVNIVGPDTDLGAGGRHGMDLSARYIHDSPTTWLASNFGHEGQHHLNRGKYSGQNAWKDEQSAGAVQLAIGNKIGFSATERTYLEHWIDSSNRVALQRHMEEGLRY